MIKKLFIYRCWMLFGKILGIVNTQILLWLLYIGVFFPFSLLMKLIGKKMITVNFKNAKLKTYWREGQSMESFTTPY